MAVTVFVFVLTENTVVKSATGVQKRTVIYPFLCEKEDRMITDIRENVAALSSEDYVYWLEKIRGVPARLSVFPDRIIYDPGELDYETFVNIFPLPQLRKLVQHRAVCAEDYTIYGVCYGEIRNMAPIYGSKLGFIVHDVFFESSGKYLNVPEASRFVRSLGLDFVAWEAVPAKMDDLEKLQCLNSHLGGSRGMGDHPVQGIVIRPMEEKQHHGKRWLFKLEF